MSLLLYCVGAIAFLAGLAMAGLGIPVTEFSFGNTMISAGATTAVGGLILIGLGAVVAKLQHIADSLSTLAPIRPGRALDSYEAALGSQGAAAPGRIPFPPKPKAEPVSREPQLPEPRVTVPPPVEPVAEPAGQSFAPTFAPTLRNPDEPPVTVEAEEVSLSPRHPTAAPGSAAGRGEAPVRSEPPAGAEESSADEAGYESPVDTGWRSAPLPPRAPEVAPTRQHSSYFDTMWPAETRTSKAPAEPEAMPEPELDLPPPEPAVAPAPHQEEEPEAVEPATDEPPAVAVLKSGVVDGMAYTLYVDGSIEAELPQGTLRFASINELRDHLEKNS